MSQIVRTVEVRGDDVEVSLRMLVDAVDLIAAEAPDTATISMHVGGTAVQDVLAALAKPNPSLGRKAPEWRVFARWHESWDAGPGDQVPDRGDAASAGEV